jgi:hypothetical protein
MRVVNTALRTVLIVLGVLVVAAGFFFGGMLAVDRGLFFARSGMPAAAWNTGAWGYGPGMMNRGNDSGQGFYGPGMMGNYRRGDDFGPGMMGNGRGRYGMGPGMMGGYGWNGAQGANATPLTADQARLAAQKYVDSLKLTDLAVGEVMVFDNNAYVVVKETSTGMGAFELLVNPVSQTAFPEPGADMMWNLKYGALNHAGMMGGRGGMMGLWSASNATPADVSADMPVTAEAAQRAAQAFLDQYQSGTTASSDPVKFYGYYTFDFTRDGKVAGMLSVNGYNGQVFLHTWHGTFVEEAQ